MSKGAELAVILDDGIPLGTPRDLDEGMKGNVLPDTNEKFMVGFLHGPVRLPFVLKSCFPFHQSNLFRTSPPHGIQIPNSAFFRVMIFELHSHRMDITNYIRFLNVISILPTPGFVFFKIEVKSIRYRAKPKYEYEYSYYLRL